MTTHDESAYGVGMTTTEYTYQHPRNDSSGFVWVIKSSVGGHAALVSADEDTVAFIVAAMNLKSEVDA